MNNPILIKDIYQSSLKGIMQNAETSDYNINFMQPISYGQNDNWHYIQMNKGLVGIEKTSGVFGFAEENEFIGKIIPVAVAQSPLDNKYYLCPLVNSNVDAREKAVTLTDVKLGYNGSKLFTCYEYNNYANSVTTNIIINDINVKCNNEGKCKISSDINFTDFVPKDTGFGYVFVPKNESKFRYVKHNGNIIDLKNIGKINNPSYAFDLLNNQSSVFSRFKWKDMLTPTTFNNLSNIKPYFEVLEIGGNRGLLAGTYGYGNLTNIIIDPTYTLNITTSDSKLDNVVCEGGGLFCHLNISDEDLVLYYPFDVENQTNLTYDWSENNVDAVMYNGGLNWSATQGIYGGAYFTGGTTSEGNLHPLDDSALDFNGGDFSVFFWVKLDPNDNAYALNGLTGRDGYQSAKARRGWTITDTSAGDLSVVVGNCTASSTIGSYYIDTGTDLRDFEWHHIGFVADQVNKNLSVYKDGVIITSGVWNFDNIICDISNQFYIFDDNYHPADMTGTIDEYMIFSKALTGTEVNNIYTGIYQRFKAKGTQIINQTISSGDNKVNASINFIGQNGSNANLSLSFQHDTGNTTFQNITDSSNYTFIISDTTEYLNGTYDFFSDANRFWSPILNNSIIWSTYSEGGADTTPPYFTTIGHIESDTSLAINEDFDAADETSFDCFAVNDTTNFAIDCTGQLTNKTEMTAQIYTLNITINDSSNNLNSTWIWVNVSAYSPPVDNEYPVFSTYEENPSDPATYTFGANYKFNVSILSSNGSAWISIGDRNITASNVSEEFEANVGDLPAGTYVWNYSAYGNGTSHNFNMSNDQTYTINKADPSTNMVISGTTPIEYGVTSDFSESETNNGDGGCSYSLNESNKIFGAGTWIFNYSTSGCANYTSGSVTKNLVVNKNSSLVLGLTATNPIDVGTSTDFAGSGCPSELTCNLNISNGQYSAGTISANYSTSGNDNYTATSTTFTVTINKKIPQGEITNDTVMTRTYDGTYTTIGLSESNSWDDDVTYIIYKNGVSTGTGFSEASAGTYNIVLNTTGGVNWTANASMDTATLTINKASAQTNLTFSVTSPQTYGTKVTPYCSVIKGEGTPILYLDDSPITSGVELDLGAGTYEFNCSVAETQNYTIATNVSSYTINKASPSISLTATTPITYGTTTDFTGSNCPSQLSCNLNISNAIYGAGTISANYSTSGNANYTSDSDVFTVTINKAIGVVYTYINGSRGNLTILQNHTANLSGRRVDGEGDIDLYNNGTLNATGSPSISIVYNYTIIGAYNITTIINATQNYTSAFETWWVNVKESIAPPSLINISRIFPNEPLTVPYIQLGKELIFP